MQVINHSRDLYSADIYDLSYIYIIHTTQKLQYYRQHESSFRYIEHNLSPPQIIKKAVSHRNPCDCISYFYDEVVARWFTTLVRVRRCLFIPDGGHARRNSLASRSPNLASESRSKSSPLCLTLPEIILGVVCI